MCSVDLASREFYSVHAAELSLYARQATHIFLPNYLDL